MAELTRTVGVQMDRDVFGKLERMAVHSKRLKSSVIRALICLAAGERVRELGLPHKARPTHPHTEETHDEDPSAQYTGRR